VSNPPLSNVRTNGSASVTYPGPNPNGSGNVAFNVNIPLATLVELRVISDLLNTSNLNLNNLRADELYAIVQPGSIS